ncbi:MAG: hypothetical protein AB7G68_04485 [Nitrospiraceae bacterium]
MSFDALRLLTIEKGMCYALLVYDIGAAVDLEEADRRITAVKERPRIRHKLRAPQHLEYRPAPLRVIQETSALSLGQYMSSSCDLMLYDFGAFTVTYKIPVTGSFSGLLELSEVLYDNQSLQSDSQQWVEQFIEDIREAIDKPHVAADVEDYVIFHIEETNAAQHHVVWSAFEQELAQILRCERAPLSEQETRDAVSQRLSFRTDDIAFIDWNAAFLFGPDMEDVRAVLEFANVELLEMRLLDQQLDLALDQAYEALAKKSTRRLSLPQSYDARSDRIAQMQVDSAILFERVANTLKLVGDQYLARVYRLISRRFHLEDWDASILRKLQTLDSIYGKTTDRAATLRMEVLEWIIVVLIAVSIAVSFLPH